MPSRKRATRPNNPSSRRRNQDDSSEASLPSLDDENFLDTSSVEQVTASETPSVLNLEIETNPVATVIARYELNATAMELRRLIGEEMDADSEFVTKLANANGGLDVLQKVMSTQGSLPWWVYGRSLILNNAPFFQKVMEQRYGLTFTGSWSEDELRHVWQAAQLVPVSHLRDTVDTMARSGGMASFFAERGLSDQAQSYENAQEPAQGKRTIGMTKYMPLGLSMGVAEGLVRTGQQKFLMRRSQYSDRMREKNAFDMTVLHEVGHAVDAKLGLMDQFGERSDFGGWKSYGSLDDAVRAMCDSFSGQPVIDVDRTELDQHMQNAPAKSAPFLERRRFNDKKKRLYGQVQAEEQRQTEAGWKKEFKGKVSLLQMRALMLEVMKGRKVKDAVANHQDLRRLTKSERSAVAEVVREHPLIQMCKLGRRGWEHTRSSMAPFAGEFEDRVFHKAYKGARDRDARWVSYELKARNDGVSHYQWRAPGEWFAELYAHFFMGTLKGHPLYDWFEQNIKNNEACQPDQVQAPQEPNQNALAEV